MQVHAECHCGAVAYEAAVDPETAGICHCTDCQTLSGTAFRTSVRATADGFRLLRGQPKTYVKTADSGRHRAQAFCPDCGTPLWSADAENPASYTLRVGTIAERAALTPRRQIWCRSALPWSLDVSGLEQRDRE